MKKHKGVVGLEIKTGESPAPDKEADFEKEVVDIYPWLLCRARKYCPSLKDAEDLTGDTICKLLENKGRFREGESLKPWCIIILRNTFLTMYNKKQLIKFVSYESVLDADISFNSLSSLYCEEILLIIKKCTQKTKCMESLILYAKGYSYDEISLLLNIPVGTVRSRISSGRKVLGRELDFMHPQKQ